MILRMLRMLGACMALAAIPAAGAGARNLENGARGLESLAHVRSQDEVANAIALRFARLAGSEDNAAALVQALRTGATVRLVASRMPEAAPQGLLETVTFETPVGEMAWADVAIALGLADEMLTRAGLVQPNAAQLQAVLVGGSLGSGGVTVEAPGLLRLRADGMEWDDIARAAGARLAVVTSSVAAARLAVSKVRPKPRAAVLLVRSPRIQGFAFAGTGAEGRAEGD